MKNSGHNEPVCCRDKDDFMKFFMSIVVRHSRSEHQAECLVNEVQMLLHDYLVLVEKGEMDRYKYEIDRNSEDYKEFIKDFRSDMTDIAEEMIQNGVPMEESEFGRMKVKFSELHKEIDDDEE